MESTRAHGWDQGFEIWDARGSPDITKLRMRKWARSPEIEGGFDRRRWPTWRSRRSTRSSTHVSTRAGPSFSSPTTSTSSRALRRARPARPFLLRPTRAHRTACGLRSLLAVAEFALGSASEGVEARGLADTGSRSSSSIMGRALPRIRRESPAREARRFDRRGTGASQLVVPYLYRLSCTTGCGAFPATRGDLRPTVDESLDVSRRIGRSRPPSSPCWSILLLAGCVAPVFNYRRPSTKSRAVLARMPRGWKYIERVDESAPQLFFPILTDPRRDPRTSSEAAKAARQCGAMSRLAASSVRRPLDVHADLLRIHRRPPPRARLRRLNRAREARSAAGWVPFTATRASARYPASTYEKRKPWPRRPAANAAST